MGPDSCDDGRNEIRVAVRRVANRIKARAPFCGVARATDGSDARLLHALNFRIDDEGGNRRAYLCLELRHADHWRLTALNGTLRAECRLLNIALDHPRLDRPQRSPSRVDAVQQQPRF